MLQTIREKATGILGIAIIVLISITFALWGVQNYFMGNVDRAVATVNGVEIDAQDFEQRYAQYRSRLVAQGVDTNVLDEPIRRREFLEAMIDSEVWRQAALASGVEITREEIRERIQGIEAFRVDGEFNPDVYVELLTVQGLTPQMLEADVRESALVEQIPEVVSQTAWAAPSEVDRLAALINQRRSFDYLTVASEALLETVTVTDEDVASYYEANRSQFREPEKVAIEYVEIDAQDYAEDIVVDDLVLQEIYEQEKGRFRTPERRQASHILLEVADDAEQAAIEDALAKARELADEARGAEDVAATFAALAEEHSDDFVSAEEGGDLGWISGGEMVEPFENVLFDLSEGAVSDPFRTPFGYHVIYLREIEPERGETFEEARDELAAEYREAEAERQFLGLQDELEERLNYSDVPDMQDAAEEMGLEVRETGLFPRSGGQGIAARPEVITAAFSELVLDEGLVSDPVLLEGNHVVFLRVIEHEESRVLPLEDVRDAAAVAARREAAQAAARERAEALAAAARDGASLQALAEEEQGDLSYESVEAAARFGGSTPRALLERVFELPHPPEGEAEVHVVEAPEEAYTVVALRSVEAPDDATADATAQFLAMRAERSYSAAELAALGRALRAAADVSINESLVSGSTGL